MKATDQHDDDAAICPYCLASNKVDAKDFTEIGTEIECRNCERIFHYRTHFSVSHITRGDCALNNETHDWEDSGHFGVQFCPKCDQRKATTKNQ